MLTLPRRECGSASVTTTSIIWPTRRWLFGPPSKLTMRLHSVRPISSCGFFLLGPSTRMRCTVPTRLALMARTFCSTVACRCCRRFSFIACGVSSARLAAGVPGRGLKMKLKLAS